MSNHTGIGVVSEEGGNDIVPPEQHVIPLPYPLTPGEPVAHVEYGCGLTINVGNFSNIRPHVQVTLPCDISKIDQAYVYAVQWVDERLEAINLDIRSQLSGDA